MVCAVPPPPGKVSGGWLGVWLGVGVGGGGGGLLLVLALGCFLYRRHRRRQSRPMSDSVIPLVAYQVCRCPFGGVRID